MILIGIGYQVYVHLRTKILFEKFFYFILIPFILLKKKEKEKNFYKLL